MTREDKIEEIRGRARSNFSLGYNCAECVTEAVFSLIDTGMPVAVKKCATGFGGGIAINPDVFNVFFTQFHHLFFEGDSWLFLFSDTLIRLFPIRFWEDTFLAGAGIVLAGGLGLAPGLVCGGDCAAAWRISAC